MEAQCSSTVQASDLQVDAQHLLRHVIVVQLVVTEGDVSVEGHVIAAVKQNALVRVDGLRVVAAAEAAGWCGREGEPACDFHEDKS